MLFASNLRRNIDYSFPSGSSTTLSIPKSEAVRILEKKQAQLHRRRHTCSVLTVSTLAENTLRVLGNHEHDNKNELTLVAENRCLSNSRGRKISVFDLNMDKVLIFDTLKLALAPDRRMSGTYIAHTVRRCSSNKISQQGLPFKMGLLQETTSKLFSLETFRRASRSNINRRSSVLTYLKKKFLYLFDFVLCFVKIKEMFNNLDKSEKSYIAILKYELYQIKIALLLSKFNLSNNL